MIHFLDSSVIVKKYLTEDGTDLVRKHFSRSAKTVAVSRTTEIEVTSAVSRAYAAGRLDQTERDAVLTNFSRDLPAFVVVELRPRVARTACELAIKHSLRAFDAVQLAAASSLAKQGVTLTFWCVDVALADAARAEQLRVTSA